MLLIVNYKANYLINKFLKEQILRNMKDLKKKEKKLYFLYPKRKIIFLLKI